MTDKERPAWRLVTSSPSSTAHEHNYDGQTLRHSHEGGRTPHGYFEHTEDGHPHAHTEDGPEGCHRCQLLRDLAGVDWAAIEAAAVRGGSGGVPIEIDHAEAARVIRNRLRAELGEPGCGMGMQVQEPEQEGSPGPGRFAHQASALAVEPRNVELSESRRIKLLAGLLGLDPATRADLLELVEHWAFSGFVDTEKRDAQKIMMQLYEKGGLK